LAVCFIFHQYYFNNNLIIVAKAIETCRWLIVYVTVYFTGLHLLVHYISVNITEVCAFAQTLSPANPALPADVKTATNLESRILKYEHYMLFVPTLISARLTSHEK
jgi:hypothetical protein